MVKSKVEIKLFMMSCLKKRLNVILIDIQILWKLLEKEMRLKGSSQPINIGKTGVILKSIETVYVVIELPRTKQIAILTDTQIFKKPLEWPQFLGSKPKFIGINSVIKRRETIHVKMHHSFVLKRVMIAAVQKVSSITLKEMETFKSPTNGQVSTKINSMVVRFIVVMELLVIHSQVFMYQKIAGVSHGPLN